MLFTSGTIWHCFANKGSKLLQLFTLNQTLAFHPPGETKINTPSWLLPLELTVTANKGPKYLATNSMQIYFSVGKTSLPHGWDMIHFSGYGESEGKGRDFAEMTSLHPSSPNPQKVSPEEGFPVRKDQESQGFLPLEGWQKINKKASVFCATLGKKSLLLGLSALLLESFHLVEEH